MYAVGLEKNTSEIIKAARVLCILSVITVHLWPRSSAILSADLSEVERLVFFGILSFLGRSSVPFLSVISGILLVCGLTTKCDIGKLILRKSTTLLLPIIFWSIPALCVLFIDWRFFGGEYELPTTILGWINGLTGIKAYPINGPLHFLRDIFVMSIIGGIIFQIFQFSRIAASAFALVFVFIEIVMGGILLRPLISIFYFSGMFLALHGKSNWRPTLSLAMTVFVVGEILSRTVNSEVVGNLIHSLPRRISITLLTWWFCDFVIARVPQFKMFVSKMEPHIFVLFCSHGITANAFAILGRSWGLTPSDSLFVPFWLLQFCACVAVGVAASHLLKDAWFANGGKRNRV